MVNRCQVGQDSGFFNAKTVTKHGQFVMPSRARAGGAKSVNVLGGASKEMVFRTEGRDFTVGAMRSDSTTFADYHTSHLNRVITHGALHAAGLGNVEVDLITSVPFRHYYLSNGSRNEKLIQGKIENLKTDVVWVNPDDGDPSSVLVKDVVVIPEGQAAWFDYVVEEVEDNGKVFGKLNQERASETVALVDVGGQTTEIVLIAEGDVQMEFSTSEDIGMHRIYEEIQDHLRDKGLGTLSMKRLDELYRNRFLTVGGKQHSFKGLIEACEEKVVTHIHQAVQHNLAPVYGEIDRFCFFGGTVEPLGDLLRRDRFLKNAYLMDKPLWSNANGLFKYGQYLRQ